MYPSFLRLCSRCTLLERHRQTRRLPEAVQGWYSIEATLQGRRHERAAVAVVEAYHVRSTSNNDACLPFACIFLKEMKLFFLLFTYTVYGGENGLYLEGFFETNSFGTNNHFSPAEKIKLQSGRNGVQSYLCALTLAPCGLCLCYFCRDRTV